MFSKEIQSALNEQINSEFLAWYTYLAMSSYFKSVNLNGFSRWMEKQAQRELTHAMKVYEFLHEREAPVAFKSIPEPPAGWRSPLDAISEAYRRPDQRSGRSGNEEPRPCDQYVPAVVRERTGGGGGQASRYREEAGTCG